MDSSYAPQSPDISSYTPQSPDLSGGFRPESPDLNLLGAPQFGDFASAPSSHYPPNNGYGYGYGVATAGYQPTSIHQQALYNQHATMPPRPVVKREDDDEYMPDIAPAPKRGRKPKQEPMYAMNGMNSENGGVTINMMRSEETDPTLGCRLNTSFPVARIKRIMQADEDIGKVAQVTPTVVSRALELFMIKLISASADQARGSGQAAPSKGPKRVLAQHLKKAVLADENFDFLHEIVNKVSDAPTKGKKETTGSDSEETRPKRKGKKRKDSGDDF